MFRKGHVCPVTSVFFEVMVACNARRGCLVDRRAYTPGRWFESTDEYL